MSEENQFKSPLASCICCRKVRSAKGIFSHFLISHTEEGKQKWEKAKERSKEPAKLAVQKIAEQNKQTYESSPNKCLHCNQILPYKSRGNKFCNRSCSASAGNATRKATGWSWTAESKKRVSEKVKSKFDYSTVETTCITCEKTFFRPHNRPGKVSCGNPSCFPSRNRTCSVCGLVETTKGNFQSDKCSFCNDSLTYRRKCEFKFNLKDYPDEFDFQLLTEHGMFSPKKNPKGVSRDHMLSVQYGKENRIDPAIISHPANCKLMLQGENTTKKSKSSITYDDLLKRIQVWNSRYG